MFHKEKKISWKKGDVSKISSKLKKKMEGSDRNSRFKKKNKCQKLVDLSPQNKTKQSIIDECEASLVKRYSENLATQE